MRLLPWIIFYFHISVVTVYGSKHNPQNNYLEDIQRASTIYTNGSLLQSVQSLSIYNDSKTFVDMPMKVDPEIIMKKWSQLSIESQQNKTIVTSFVETYFDVAGSDLVEAVPSDIQDSLQWMIEIKNSSYRQWASDLNQLWKELGRNVHPLVYLYPQRYSILKRDHLFIIPGGRFHENYYWDSYWILLGLLACEAYDTSKGMILNFIHDINLFGYIPNGGRVYYLNRSQPPLLSEMILSYILHSYQTKGIDLHFLHQSLNALEKEYRFWMKESDNSNMSTSTSNGFNPNANTMNTHAIRLDQKHVLNRYYSNPSSPRPESYREDMESCINQTTSDTLCRCYSNIASTAESGWDFSGRWFCNNSIDTSYPMSSLATRSILPVDLNSILLRMEQNMAILYELQEREEWNRDHDRDRNHDHDEDNIISICLSKDSIHRDCFFQKSNDFHNIQAKYFWLQSRQRVIAMQMYLWDKKLNKYKDYWISDIDNVVIRKDVIEASKVSEYFPIWAGIFSIDDYFQFITNDKDVDVDRNRKQVLQSILESGLINDWGVQVTTLSQRDTNQQWDSPNAWPPLQLITIEVLYSLGLEESIALADQVIDSWLESNYKGWQENGMIYEKYNAQIPGQRGEGGEYPPQVGFGWSNGVILYLLRYYYHYYY